MNRFATRLPQRRSLARAAVALVVASAVLAVHGPGARAALAGCRSDPLITVDGQTIRLVDVISADASQVSSVHYDLHLPASTEESGVRFVGDNTGIPEDAVIYFDQPDGQMLAYTTVTTDPAAGFAVSVTIRSAGSSSSATGVANQPIAARISW